MYRLLPTDHFRRQLRSFLKRHQALAPVIEQVLRDLEADPFQPHLRLHPLRGKHAGTHAVRVTPSVRLTLTLRIAEEAIYLLDIGAHDDVYR